GQQLQLQAQGALFARGPGGGLPWCAVGRALEPGVAEAMEPTLGDQQSLPVGGQVAELLAGVGVENERADRHRDLDVVAALAGTPRAHTVLAALRGEAPLHLELRQRVDAFVDNQPDAAAVAAVTAVGTAERNVFLTTEAVAAAAAVAAGDLDDSFINEFH